MRVSKTDRARTTYRHGDLRRALVEAGVALARDGGPDAVVLREATRRAGVVPNAAYRHFASRDALLAAVRAEALAAASRAIEREIAAAASGDDDTAASARANFRAVGIGYLRFAWDERGLFRTAFSQPDATGGDADPRKAGDSGLNPFQLLGAALDRLVVTRQLPAARRPGAEHLAWSAVHGLAMLVIEGPLGPLGDPAGSIGERLIDMIERGL